MFPFTSPLSLKSHFFFFAATLSLIHYNFFSYITKSWRVGLTEEKKIFAYYKYMNEDNNRQQYVKIKVNEIVVSIHVLYFHGIGVFAFVFCSNLVGKRFIIVHGNYVECSHFLSIHCYFEKDHHDLILWARYVNHFYLHRRSDWKKEIKQQQQQNGQTWRLDVR